ncbi:hypothetical protein GCM10009733_014190 [Nonomuraea maheshkhaliensis]|uniref:Uncharacterized protein n=1 Tax=Nonomuraea maheshkhaliensis TaxID=419590 RepID=A0ABN2EXL9_9ACTN
MWPELTVRSWRGVHDLRAAHEHADYSDDLHDRVNASMEARRIHELRGMFMAQTAEIEDLLHTLLRLIVEHCPEWLPASATKAKKLPASRVLEIIRAVATSTGKANELHNACAQISWLLARRNQLVHAIVHIGYSSPGPDARREPVIVLLMEIQGNTIQVPWEFAPRLEDARNPGDIAWDGDCGEISELHLKEDLRRAFIVLEGAVDIFQALGAPLELLLPKHSAPSAEETESLPF